MRTKVVGLTKKQKDVLDIIKKFQAKYKYPPSVRQIGKEIGINSPATIHVHLNGLINKGYIKRSEYGNKALELLVPNEYDTKSDEVINVPYIDLNKKYNIDIELETPSNLYSLPSNLIPHKKPVFVIKNNTNSLSNNGIIENDIVIIERTNKINDNDIIVINNENKLLIKEYNEENNIIGKVIGLYRKY